MTILRFFPALMLLPLGACGAPETPQAAPGTVERLTVELDEQEEAERGATVRRNAQEAKLRSQKSAQRIAAVERKAAKP